jgi:hypothetical protein
MSRREVVAAASFVLVNLLVPVFCVELYPFTRAPMFEDSPRRYCNFTVHAPDGRVLPPADFGVQRNYQAIPPDKGFGFLPRPTINEMDQVPDSARVAAWVRQHLRRFPDLEYVDVVQEVVAAVDGDRVGVVQTRRARVDNPSYRGGS